MLCHTKSVNWPGLSSLLLLLLFGGIIEPEMITITLRILVQIKLFCHTSALLCLNFVGNKYRKFIPNCLEIFLLKFCITEFQDVSTTRGNEVRFKCISLHFFLCQNTLDKEYCLVTDEAYHCIYIPAYIYFLTKSTVV